MGTCEVEFRFQGKPPKTVIVDTDKIYYSEENKILKTALLDVGQKSRSRITEALIDGKTVPFGKALKTLKEERKGVDQYGRLKTTYNSYF